MLSEMAKDKEYLRAAEIIQRAERNGRRLGFTNQIKMSPFDIIFMFLILPIVATTTCWIILKDSKNNGKDQ